MTTATHDQTNTARARRRDERDDETVENNIREIFMLFGRGDIDEETAKKLLEDARRSRHNVFERYLTFLAK